jgi:hypothetical protein
MDRSEARTQAGWFREDSALKRFWPTDIVALLEGLDWLDWFAILGFFAVVAQAYYAFWR